MLYLDRHIYFIISEYLGDVHTIKSLDRVSQNSRDLCKHISLLKELFKLQGSDRFITSAAKGFMDGVLYWETDDSDVRYALDLAASNGHLDVVKYLLHDYNINDTYRIQKSILGMNITIKKYEPLIHKALTAPNSSVVEFLWPQVKNIELYIPEISGSCVLFLINQGIKPDTTWSITPKALVELALLNSEAATIFLTKGYVTKKLEVFNRCCALNIFLVQWFLSLEDLQMIELNQGFKIACYSNQQTIATYLYNTYGMIIDVDTIVALLRMDLCNLHKSVFSEPQIIEFCKQNLFKIENSLYHDALINKATAKWFLESI